MGFKPAYSFDMTKITAANHKKEFWGDDDLHHPLAIVYLQSAAADIFLFFLQHIHMCMLLILSKLDLISSAFILLYYADHFRFNSDYDIIFNISHYILVERSSQRHCYDNV